jgi:hypothetical protein
MLKNYENSFCLHHLENGEQSGKLQWLGEGFSKTNGLACRKPSECIEIPLNPNFLAG